VETIIVRIDTPNPVLADVRVREAIALAIDKEAIMNDILGGGEVANQIVSSSALGWNSTLEPYPYDPTRAAELIAEAAADGLDVTAPFTFAARTGFILRADEIIQFISEALNTAGMTGVTPQMMETAQFEELWSDAGYANVSPDRAFIGMNQHGNEMMDYAGSVGNYFMCEGGASAFCDPAFDEMARTAFQVSGDARDQAPSRTWRRTRTTCIRSSRSATRVQLRLGRRRQLDASDGRVHPDQGVHVLLSDGIAQSCGGHLPSHDEPLPHSRTT
jgi:peptide/nickel transport system substrate-binding protein